MRWRWPIGLTASGCICIALAVCLVTIPHSQYWIGFGAWLVIGIVVLLAAVGAYDEERAYADARNTLREHAPYVSPTEAKERARSLLEEYLTPQQRADLTRYNAFLVDTPHGLFELEVGRSRSHNIYEIDRVTKTRTCSYCIHTANSAIPLEDNVLIQKLMLESDFERFMSMANPAYYGPTDRRPMRCQRRDCPTIPADIVDFPGDIVDLPPRVWEA